MSTFVISDSHFFHTKIIGYCNRPFKNADEMNRAMIKNWNSVVKVGDTVYHVGDVACGPDALEGPMLGIFSALNGTIKLIPGNHDSKKRLQTIPFEKLDLRVDLSYKGKLVVLSHYPHLTWPEAHKGSIHLFGHVHGKYKGFGRSMDVGVDTNNFTPLDLDEVVDKLSKIDVYQSI